MSLRDVKKPGVMPSTAPGCLACHCYSSTLVMVGLNAVLPGGVCGLSWPKGWPSGHVCPSGHRQHWRAHVPLTVCTTLTSLQQRLSLWRTHGRAVGNVTGPGGAHVEKPWGLGIGKLCSFLARRASSVCRIEGSWVGEQGLRWKSGWPGVAVSFGPPSHSWFQTC